MKTFRRKHLKYARHTNIKDEGASMQWKYSAVGKKLRHNMD